MPRASRCLFPPAAFSETRLLSSSSKAARRSAGRRRSALAHRQGCLNQAPDGHVRRRTKAFLGKHMCSIRTVRLADDGRFGLWKKKLDQFMQLGQRGMLSIPARNQPRRVSYMLATYSTSEKLSCLNDGDQGRWLFSRVRVQPGTLPGR